MTETFLSRRLQVGPEQQNPPYSIAPLFSFYGKAGSAVLVSGRKNLIDKIGGESYNPIWDYRTQENKRWNAGGNLVMDPKLLKLLADINCAVIRFRGLYAAWAKKHGISYHELLVLYTIREQGFCTQKQICDSYLLPRQTMNHVILDLRRRGLLELSLEHCVGREKAFALSKDGRLYAAPLLKALNQMETQAIQIFDQEKVCRMVETVCAYDDVLQAAMDQNS